jgi:hypothetical protein
MDRRKLIKDLKSLGLRTIGVFIILASLVTLFAGFQIEFLILFLVVSFLFNIFLDIVLSIVRMHFK